MTGKVPYLSHHTRLPTLFITIHIDLDHLAEGVFEFLYCDVISPPTPQSNFHTVLWKEVTVHSPHPSGGSYAPSLVSFLHQVFRKS